MHEGSIHLVLFRHDILFHHFAEIRRQVCIDYLIEDTFWETQPDPDIYRCGACGESSTGSGVLLVCDSAAVLDRSKLVGLSM